MGVGDVGELINSKLPKTSRSGGCTFFFLTDALPTRSGFARTRFRPIRSYEREILYSSNDFHDLHLACWRSVFMRHALCPFTAQRVFHDLRILLRAGVIARPGSIAGYGARHPS